MKNVLQPLAKSVLMPLGLNGNISSRHMNSLKNLRLGNKNTNNIKLRNERYYENTHVS